MTVYIGFCEEEKQQTITQYCHLHSITKVYLFCPDEFSLDFCLNDISVEKVRYADIIMYKTFYHLLEVVDENSLLVFNECMRTQNRNDLTYNCAHHYCNQTPHKIVFEYFPFIESQEDFMILLNFINKDKYKGKSFDYTFLTEENVTIKPIKLCLQILPTSISEQEKQSYQLRKEQLFKNLASSNPNTIPRNLHIFTGNFKKRVLEPEQVYVARNSRFGLPNVVSYTDAESNQDYIMIDFPHRRIDFNDFLKKTDMQTLYFISTGLKVDQYYINEFKAWNDRLREFYGKAGLC